MVLDKTDIALRPATEADDRLLFDWVNSTDSLAGKLETAAPIDWQTHLSWMGRRMADPATSLWIVEWHGRPVGQVRLQDRGGGIEVDVFVAPDVRGHGIARRAIAAAIEELRATGNSAPVTARVKPENSASQQLFEALGFRRIDAGRDHLVYRLLDGSGA